MDSLQIGESSNNSTSISTVIHVGPGLELNEDQIPDLSSALIVRVPKPLGESNDRFYTPELVSIGPYHYGRPELSGMEKFKSEAVRRMQKRIQNRDPDVTIQSIVEKDIVEQDRKIREFYGENISYSPLGLAWMVTRDACFVFEFIISFIRGSIKGNVLYEEMRVSSSKYDPIFDACFQNPTYDRIMDDILQFENQIPLFILQQLLQIQMGSAEAANDKLDGILFCLLARMSRQQVFSWFVGQHFNTCSHVLEVVYHGMLDGANINSYRNEARPLFPVHSLIPSSTHAVEEIDVHFGKLPSAAELNNAGVKIHPVLFRDSPAIRCIKFDEKTKTLYLPEVRVTTQSELLLRNVIAMEVSTGNTYNSPRPMTDFAKLMDELVDSEEDVVVLRSAGIIMNELGRSNKEAADVLKSLTKGMVYSRNCKAIDDVRMGLHNYMKKKYKLLWYEFVTAYVSKPWRVVDVLVTFLLLVLTSTQVLCAFYPC